VDAAWAIPERAIAAASIYDATVTNNKMRFIGATLSLMGRRKKGCSDRRPGAS